MKAVRIYITGILLSILVVGCTQEKSKPESKEDAVEPVNTTDNKSQKAWLDEREATLRSFVKVARHDLIAAIEMMALPSTIERWKLRTPELLSSPVLSKAFFTNPFYLLAGTREGRWTGGFYNPWIDTWLLLEFEWQGDVSADRITGFAWMSGGDPVRVDPEMSSDQIPVMMRNRLKLAIENGMRGAIRLYENPGHGEVFRDPAPADKLREYVAHLRTALVPEGGDDSLDLVTGLEHFYKNLEYGTSAWAVEIKECIPNPPLSLTPVYVFVRDDGATIVLSASPDPYLMVFANFEGRGSREAVLKGVEIHSLSTSQEGGAE